MPWFFPVPTGWMIHIITGVFVNVWTEDRGLNSPNSWGDFQRHEWYSNMYLLLVSIGFPDLLWDSWFGVGLPPHCSPWLCCGQAAYGCLMKSGEVFRGTNGNTEVTLMGWRSPHLVRKSWWRTVLGKVLVPHAVMSLRVRSGAITKVQSDFLKLGSSHPELTLNLKQRVVGLYPMKQPPDREEAFTGSTLWKNSWALKYQKVRFQDRAVTALHRTSETVFWRTQGGVQKL